MIAVSLITQEATLPIRCKRLHTAYYHQHHNLVSLSNPHTNSTHTMAISPISISQLILHALHVSYLLAF